MNSFPLSRFAFLMSAGLALLLVACEGVNLAKSSDETDDFKCTLETAVEDGLLNKARSIPYTIECVAKGDKQVRFVNLKTTIIATEYNNGKSRSRSVGETVPGRRGVVIGPGRSFKYSGKVGVQAWGAWKGRRSLNVSASILYPGEPELDYEADRIEKASNAWRYNLLVTKRL